MKPINLFLVQRRLQLIVIYHSIGSFERFQTWGDCFLNMCPFPKFRFWHQVFLTSSPNLVHINFTRNSLAFQHPVQWMHKSMSTFDLTTLQVWIKIVISDALVNPSSDICAVTLCFNKVQRTKSAFLNWTFWKTQFLPNQFHDWRLLCAVELITIDYGTSRKRTPPVSGCGHWNNLPKKHKADTFDIFSINDTI